MTPFQLNGLASHSAHSRRPSCGATSRPHIELLDNAGLRSATHYYASTSQSTASVCMRSRRQGTRRRVVSHALLDPPPFRPEKLAVSLAAGTSALEPAPPHSRKYTLTHNDITGSLRLTIGPGFNAKQISGFYTRLLRDEVMAEWVNVGSSGFTLHVYCHVSGEERWLAPPLLRNYIFRREMPLVLDTLVFADRQLLAAYPELAAAQVYVHFQSSVRELDTVEYWGVLGNRSTWPKGPTSILLRTIYAVVGWPPSLSPLPADLSVDQPSEVRDVDEAVRQQQEMRERRRREEDEERELRELQREWWRTAQAAGGGGVVVLQQEQEQQGKEREEQDGVGLGQEWPLQELQPHLPEEGQQERSQREQEQEEEAFGVWDGQQRPAERLGQRRGTEELARRSSVFQQAAPQAAPGTWAGQEAAALVTVTEGSGEQDRDRLPPRLGLTGGGTQWPLPPRDDADEADVAAAAGVAVVTASHLPRGRAVGMASDGASNGNGSRQLVGAPVTCVRTSNSNGLNNGRGWGAEGGSVDAAGSGGDALEAADHGRGLAPTNGCTGHGNGSGSSSSNGNGSSSSSGHGNGRSTAQLTAAEATVQRGLPAAAVSRGGPGQQQSSQHPPGLAEPPRRIATVAAAEGPCGRQTSVGGGTQQTSSASGGCGEAHGGVSVVGAQDESGSSNGWYNGTEDAAREGCSGNGIYVAALRLAEAEEEVEEDVVLTVSVTSTPQLAGVITAPCGGAAGGGRTAGGCCRTDGGVSLSAAGTERELELVVARAVPVGRSSSSSTSCPPL